jgi:hypothetical protein
MVKSMVKGGSFTGMRVRAIGKVELLATSASAAYILRTYG